jgi:hypothetical protein
VEKAAELLERGIHLLILDLFPPGPARPARASRRDLGRDLRRALHTSRRPAPGACRL